MQRVLRQARTCTFWPFDQCGALNQSVIETELFYLVFPFHPIKIEMGNRKAGRFVTLDEGEGRARHVFAKTQRGQDRPRKRGFSGAQVAFQRHGVAGLKACGNPRAQSGRFGGASKQDFQGKRRLFHGWSSSVAAFSPQRICRAWALLVVRRLSKVEAPFPFTVVGALRAVA